ncbi:MAG TPA: VOC family protein [Ramlibacter sp.]|nr:VOC family protein [Ramlibacter sp.]
MTDPLRLRGVHHTARPTWKLKETVEFYRDKLGLPLVHCVSAKGWGASDHPDFLHFFFDAGDGALIAFFYYLGTTQPERLVHRPVYDHDATHTAWKVGSREELLAWRKRLEAQGVEIMYQIEHEIVESIYFRDPNGYFVEIGVYVRDLLPLDVKDAELTIAAALRAEEKAGGPLRSAEALYEEKGRAVEALLRETA